MSNIDLRRFCPLLRQLDQQQNGRIAVPCLPCLVERQHIGVLRQRQRRLLLENVFSMAMHHTGTMYMLTFAGGE